MIGILCGLRSEALIADKIPGALVACSAANPERAQALARLMVEKGVKRLISFGLAAGLNEDIVAGDLVLGSSVMTANHAWEADEPFNRTLIDALPFALCIPIWGSQSLVRRAQDKAMLYRRTGCLAADMESHVVARVAHNARLPFNVIRAISDPYDTNLPPAALIPLQEDGRTDLRKIYKSIRTTPKQIPSLVRLGWSSALAFRSLRRAVEAIRKTKG